MKFETVVYEKLIEIVRRNKSIYYFINEHNDFILQKNIWRRIGRACVLQEALMILQEEANLVGMQISWPKTKLMAITPNPTSHLPLKICNTEVLFVNSFTYLGSLITNDGSSSRDITSRIAKAASAMYCLSNPLFRKHRISIQTKINMYRALVVSVLLYDSGAGPPPSPIAGA